MKLQIREFGQGDKLAVLIHGGAVDGRVWHAVGPELNRRGYRVLAPDLRGHGLSARGGYTDPDAFVEDLCDTLPVGADLAIGHSLGGLFLSLASEHLKPQNLVLSEPGFDQEIVPGDYFDKLRETFPPSAAALSENCPRWSDQDIEMAVAAGHMLDLDLLTAMKHFRGRNYLPEAAHAHALLQLAGRGSMVTPETAAILEQRGFTVRVVENAGHVLFNDDFDDFFRTLDGFV